MRHATDGALVRWLDRQYDPAEGIALGAHLEVCPRCRERLAGMRRKSERLRLALRRDAQRRSPPAWQITAAVAVGLLVLAAVPPVRAWVVQHASAAWLAVTRGVSQPAAGSGLPAAAGAGRVSFVPAADSFFIRITGRQQSGRLTIDFELTTVASASITGEPAGAELLVLPSGLGIANSPQSRASYVLRLPAGLAAVVLRLGHEMPLRVVPAAHPRWEMDLSAEEPR